MGYKLILNFIKLNEKQKLIGEQVNGSVTNEKELSVRVFLITQVIWWD